MSHELDQLEIKNIYKPKPIADFVMECNLHIHFFKVRRLARHICSLCKVMTDNTK